jgi:hypothetical protein
MLESQPFTIKTPKCNLWSCALKEAGELWLKNQRERRRPKTIDIADGEREDPATLHRRRASRHRCLRGKSRGPRPIISPESAAVATPERGVQQFLPLWQEITWA